MPELKKLLDEILTLETWKEIEKRFIAFRRKAKFVPKKNVMYHLYMAQEVCLFAPFVSRGLSVCAPFVSLSVVVVCALCALQSQL